MGSQCIFFSSFFSFLFFPAEVLSGGAEVPRDRALQQVSIFLERLDDRIRCSHEETVAVAKP